MSAAMLFQASPAERIGDRICDAATRRPDVFPASSSGAVYEGGKVRHVIDPQKIYACPAALIYGITAMAANLSKKIEI